MAMEKTLDAREGNTVLTDSLTEFTECILKKNTFEHNTSLFTNNYGGLSLELKWLHLRNSIYIGLEGKIS